MKKDSHQDSMGSSNMKKIVVHMECQRNTHKQHDLLSDSQRGLSAKNKTTYNGSKHSLKQNSTHSDDASCKCNKKCSS